MTFEQYNPHYLFICLREIQNVTHLELWQNATVQNVRTSNTAQTWQRNTATFGSKDGGT